MATKVRFRATGEERPVDFDELKRMIASQRVGPQDEIFDEIVTWNTWVAANNLNVFHKNSPVRHAKGEILLQKEAAEAEKERLRAIAEKQRLLEYERQRTFTADMLQESFPAGVQIPEPLRAICEYRTQFGTLISGDFRLYLYDPGELAEWFREEPETAKSFLAFGRGACGDIYAIWLTDNLTAENAPVVVFGSEGELAVIALNIREFCSLLCLGYSDAAFDDMSIPPTLSDYEDTKCFREYMLARFALSIPRSGETIHKSARDRFPNFQRWVRDDGHRD